MCRASMSNQKGFCVFPFILWYQRVSTHYFQEENRVYLAHEPFKFHGTGENVTSGLTSFDIQPDAFALYLHRWFLHFTWLQKAEFNASHSCNHLPGTASYRALRKTART